MNKRSQEIATVNTEENYGKRKKIEGTRRITYKATLVALSMALKLIGQLFTFGSYKITFVYLPWIISSIAMGPLGGAAVIFITDLLGTLILQTGGFPVPLILLSNTLFGLLMGAAFKIPRLDPKIKLLIGTVACVTVCTLGISSYALAGLYSMPFKVQFITRLTFQVPVVALNVVIVGFLFPLLKKLGLMD